MAMVSVTESTGLAGSEEPIWVQGFVASSTLTRVATALKEMSGLYN